jgi:hypothetical protein
MSCPPQHIPHPKAHKIQQVGSKSFNFLSLVSGLSTSKLNIILIKQWLKGVQHVHDSMKIRESIYLDVEMKHIIQITCAYEDLNLQVGGQMENILKVVNNLHQSHLHPVSPF